MCSNWNGMDHWNWNGFQPFQLTESFLCRNGHTQKSKIGPRDHQIRVRSVRFPPRGFETRELCRKGHIPKNWKFDLGTMPSTYPIDHDNWSGFLPFQLTQRRYMLPEDYFNSNGTEPFQFKWSCTVIDEMAGTSWLGKQHIEGQRLREGLN